MTNWPPDPGTLTRPAYRSLVKAVEAAIQNGALKPGDRLPTQRQLAFDLNLSVQTVSRAYSKLIESGKIAGEVGRGTYVRASQDDVQMPFVTRKTSLGLLDMSILKPVIDHAHEDALQEVLRAMARSVPRTVLTMSRPDRGHDFGADHMPGPSRRWLGLCGLRAEDAAIIRTNGSTAAMTVALMTAAQPGDLILAEEIGHHTLRPLTRFMGLRLRGVTVDDGGICPRALEEIARTDGVKALYLMPTGMNPLAFTMSEQRRAEVADIARRYDFLIIENHAWGPLQDAPPPPIAALAPERTLFFTSLTKCLMPGLRVGYLAVPDHLGPAAASRHMVTNWMASGLMTEIADRWISDGTAENLLHRQRLALGDRTEYAVRILEGLEYRTSPNGLHVWVDCRDAQEERALIEAVRRDGVAVASAASFSIGPHFHHTGIRVALGGQGFPEFARGMRIVARIAREIRNGQLGAQR
ncbi:PLP-dependent aminotransferase family protein [Oceaniglobus trochenteri]|uniref:MocR-like ectoine utilization transcription factor EhuR n=1 Tax=Oceaniglobus trochenteri TaxID=2763260 RepID=UPI001D00156C|nr:PLP-dependent aminotransferase family protein [Oceaniglobus trochenteri]